jgi:hypothetical protein
MQTPSEPATSTCSSDHSVDIGVPALLYGSGLGTKDSLGGLAGPCAPAALGCAQFFRAFKNTTYQVCYDPRDTASFNVDPKGSVSIVGNLQNMISLRNNHLLAFTPSVPEVYLLVFHTYNNTIFGMEPLF